MIDDALTEVTEEVTEEVVDAAEEEMAPVPAPVAAPAAVAAPVVAPLAAPAPAESPDDDDTVRELRNFLADVRRSHAFDKEDEDAIAAAIERYTKTARGRRVAEDIMTARVEALQYWGSRIDFSAPDLRHLGAFFFKKHAVLKQLVGGAASSAAAPAAVALAAAR